MADALYCFLDESGDPNFPPDGDGKSYNYVMGGITVTESRIDEVRAKAEAIRKKFFQTGEMKSKKLWKMSEKKKQEVLEAIAELEVAFVAVAVDKRRVNEDGALAKYRDSFMKYTGGLLWNRVFKVHDVVHITWDNYGDKAFMRGVADYVNRRHVSNLFATQSSFKSADSKTDVLIQVADLFAGAVMRAFRDGGEEGRALIGLFWPRLHTFVPFPRVFPSVEPLQGQSEQYMRDRQVRDFALQQADRYLAENDPPGDEDVEARMYVLEYLIYVAQFDPTETAVHADKLLEILEGRHFFDYTRRTLGAEIIGKLRDEGVLITGSAKGYAIPFTTEELDAHARDVRSKAIPMVKRLARYRQDVGARTGGELDLLGSPELEDLRKLVDALEGPQVPAQDSSPKP